MNVNYILEQLADLKSNIIQATRNYADSAHYKSELFLLNKSLVRFELAQVLLAKAVENQEVDKNFITELFNNNPDSAKYSEITLKESIALITLLNETRTITPEGIGGVISDELGYICKQVNNDIAQIKQLL